MRSLQILKVFLLLFGMSRVIVCFFEIGLSIMHLINPERGLALNLYGYEVNQSLPHSWLYLLAYTVSYVIFILGLYKIKEAVDELFLLRIFEHKVSQSFFQAGNAFLISAILNYLIFTLLQSQHGSATLLPEFEGTFESVYFHVIIGLLLRILGVVLNIANGIKAENDLTI